jgi:hypothetical protein
VSGVEDVPRACTGAQEIEVGPALLTTSKRNDPKFSPDLKFGLAVLVIGLALVSMIVFASKTRHSLPPPRCPIDNAPAEFRTERRGTTICNYGHFSTAEQKPHTWWAACQ